MYDMKALYEATSVENAVALRLEHPEDTLAELAALCDPPATKSALNHRLRKLVELGQARGEGAGPGKTI